MNNKKEYSSLEDKTNNSVVSKINADIRCKTQNNDNTFKCKICDKHYASKSSLKFHVDSIHLNIRKYNCKYCSYAATNKSQLTAHINSKHLKIKNHKCTHCHFHSFTKAMLDAHVYDVHLKVIIHECAECGFVASKTGNLKRHIEAIHLNIRRHKCSYCEYKAYQKSDIDKHIKRIHKSMSKVTPKNIISQHEAVNSSQELNKPVGIDAMTDPYNNQTVDMKTVDKNETSYDSNNTRIISALLDTYVGTPLYYLPLQLLT